MEEEVVARVLEAGQTVSNREDVKQLYDSQTTAETENTVYAHSSCYRPTPNNPGE